MTDTAKIEPIERTPLAPVPSERLRIALSEAAVWAPDVGDDIADVIHKLLARLGGSAFERLPDITHLAEAA